MPYQTGVASSPANLVDLLSTFLTTNGWTLDESSGSGDTIQRYLNDGSSFFISFDTTASRINMYPYTSYDVNDNVDDQAGVPTGWGTERGRLQNVAGSYTAYHFFLFAGADGDQVTVVVEQSPGIFRMFSFGTLEKNGTYDGGQYVSHDSHDTITGTDGVLEASKLFGNDVSGVNQDCGVIRVGGLDGFSEDWVGHEQITGHGTTGRKFMWTTADGNVTAFPAAFYGNYTVKATYATFWPPNPIEVWIARNLDDSTPASISNAGRVRHIYEINTSDFQPNEVVTIGADDYLVFPAGQKTESLSDGAMPNAYRYGFLINRDM